jgi:hypothetical protein
MGEIMLNKKNSIRLWVPLTLVLLFAGCSETAKDVDAVGVSDAASAGAPADQEVDVNPLKNAYFGDTHIHTELSFDAFLFGTRRTPNDAYLFAKGAGIEHASGFEMKMKKPLDFLAV